MKRWMWGASLLVCSALAQTPDPEWRHKLLTDWAGLTRYGSEDTEVRPPKAGETRVVFLGDQVTEHWPEGKFFPGKPYLNRGVDNQTSGQMLVRFRQDVINLQPKVVIIQAGNNDLAGLAGPMTEPMIGENLTSMVELAKVHGIKVILASALPVAGSRMTPGKIIGLNGWIKGYAAKNGAVYLNYYGALAEGREFKKELTDDGLLPNAAGYAVMAPLAEQAIAESLGK
jgi:lysophospholipase L1-like esterase